MQQHNAKFLPENSEIRWLDDDMMSYMIRSCSAEMSLVGDAKESGVCPAFFNLRPGACRADVWSACVLWKYGGLYVDSEMILLRPVNEITDLSLRDNVFIPQDFHPQGLYKAMIYASQARMKYLEIAVFYEIITRVEYYVTNINNKAEAT